MLNIISDKLTGVLNGIDMDAVDPSKTRGFTILTGTPQESGEQAGFPAGYDLPQEKGR